MPYAVDQSTGARVYVDQGGVYLRNSAGEIGQVSPDVAKRLLASGGHEAVTSEQVADYRIQKRHGGLGSQVATAAEAGARGGIDVVLTPFKAASAAGAALSGGEDQLAEISGAQVLRDTASVAGDVIDALRGDMAPGEMRAIPGAAYGTEARERAEANPLAATGGYIAGQLAAGGGIAKGATALAEGATAALGGGTAARVAGQALGMGAEGAVLGAAAASEEAFLEGRAEVTGEQMFTGAGVGALLGGALGAGTAGAGAAARGIFGRGRRAAGAADDAGQAIGRLDDAGPSPEDVIETVGREVSDEGIERVAQGVLGVKPAPGLGKGLRETIEGLQSASTGAERGTLEKFGALRGDATAKRGRDLWRRRDEIVEEATGDISEHLQRVAEDGREVFDEVVDSGLKREHIASRIEGDTAAQLSAARSQLRQVQEGLDDVLRRADEFGNRKLVENEALNVQKLAARAHNADDAAEAFIALDKVKRALQKQKLRIERSAHRQPDALRAGQAQSLAQRLEQLQEPTRQLLMDDKLWGRAGQAQKQINGAWERYLKTTDLFESDFLRRAGTDYTTGTTTRVVDPGRVSNFMRKLGRRESELTNRNLREHLDAKRELAEAIEQNFDLGAKRGTVARIRDSTEAISGALGKADETVAVANQIDAVIGAEAGGALGNLGALGAGAVVGGAPGAAVGALLGGVTRPGQLIRQRAAIEAMAERTGFRMDGGIAKFLAKLGGKAARGAADGGGDALAKVRKAARASGERAREAEVSAAVAFQRHGESRRSAYQRHAEDISGLAASQERLTQRIGKMPAMAVSGTHPRLGVAVTATATRAARYLAQSLPVPARDPHSLTPLAKEPPPISDADLDRFEAKWRTVTDPMSVLDDLASGKVTQDQVDALRAVYPQMYEQMRNKIMQAVAERTEPLPYQGRAQLDILLDAQGRIEPTLAPDFLARRADDAKRIAAEQAPQPRPSSKAPDIAGGARTHSQKLEAEL